MRTSVFRDYVKKIANAIKESHKWRKADVKFSSRHSYLGKFNLAAIILSKARVYWIVDSSAADEDLIYIQKMIEGYHDAWFGKAYKLFGSNLVENEAPRTIANRIIDMCRKDITITVSSIQE